MTSSKILNFIKSDSSLIDQLFFCLILLFTFSNCLHHFTAVRNISLSLGGILFFFTIKRKNFITELYNPLLWPIFLFGLWALLGIFFSPLSFSENLHDFVSHYLKYVLFFLCIIQVINSAKRLNVLLWGVVLSCTTYYAWVMTYFYIIADNPLTQRLGTGYSEFVTNKEGFLTITAIFFAIMLFKNTNRKPLKIFLAFCILELIIASILPQSRGSVLALIISLLVYNLKDRTILFPAIFSILVIVAFTHMTSRLSPDNFFKPGIRKDILLFSTEIIKEAPVIGMGFNIDVFKDIRTNQPEKYESYKTKAKIRHNFSYRRPHSSLLSITVRMGVVGLLLYSWIMFTFIKMAFRGVYSGNTYLSDMSLVMISSFFAFFVNGLFEPTFTHRVDTIFYLLLGIQSILWIIENKKVQKWQISAEAVIK